MSKISTNHNNIDIKEKEEYQFCAGKGCNNKGTSQLMIIYVNKIGWFCDICKEELIDLKLVEAVK